MVDFTDDLMRDFTNGRILNHPKRCLNDPKEFLVIQKGGYIFFLFRFGSLKTPFWVIKNTFLDD
jgi:hypothetical protein